MPKDSGVTSSKSEPSVELPINWFAVMDAPIATTSSGLIVHKGSWLNTSRTAFCTAYERVEPPTNTTF